MTERLRSADTRNRPETPGAGAEEDARVTDRPGEFQDIAPVVAILPSDTTTWIRGANVPVDGGMSFEILCEMLALRKSIGVGRRREQRPLRSSSANMRKKPSAKLATALGR